MKLLFDLFPIILFFVAYKIADVYVATLTAIVATFAQVFWAWFRHRKVDPMLWMGLILIVIFGGATLFLHNEMFIKWKPTILYWLLAFALLVSEIFFKKNLISAAMSKHISVTDRNWRVLNFAWSGFFIALGAINIYIATQYSTDVWVNFKLFGSTGLTVVFVIVQSIWLTRHIKHGDKL